MGGRKGKGCGRESKLGVGWENPETFLQVFFNFGPSEIHFWILAQEQQTFCHFIIVMSNGSICSIVVKACEVVGSFPAGCFLVFFPFPLHDKPGPAKSNLVLCCLGQNKLNQHLIKLKIL